LRLTVALFAMAIVLIFAGTLAQVDKDIWEVMHLYFRAWFAWIPLQIFFPPVFFPELGPVPGGLYFPGGFLIASAMAVNLLAAHGVRFTVQARGARLASGLAVLALGVLITCLVVLGGSDKEIVEGTGDLNVRWLWGGVEAALAMLWLSLLYGIWEVGAARKWERRLLIAAGAIAGVVLGVVLYNGPAAMPDPSAMRILWQLVKATSAALVLLAGCILVFRKRAGIVLLHAGVGLMMINELVVYSLHSEGMMPLGEGELTNYAQDVRTVELAVTSPAEKPAAGQNVAETAREPEGRLEDVTVVRPRWSDVAGVIRNPLLPFDVKVLEYYPNSQLRPVRKGDDNPATEGAGKRFVPAQLKTGSGTDVDQKVDLASAYVKLLTRGSDAPIGTYLLSMGLAPQSVVVDGKPYAISLRFKRDYKPYIVRLIDVRKDDYDGTDKPRNYSSRVQIIDPAQHVDREVKIWMNNPLRYAGDTLYQSGYHPGPPETTTLQVVKNIGWMIPYVGCMIVATGMLAHFSLTLTRFLRRRDAEELSDDANGGVEAVPGTKKPRRKAMAGAGRSQSRLIGVAVPATVVVILAGWLTNHARQPAPVKGDFHYYEFGKLPLVYEGRTKPVDTLARNALLVLSGRQTFKGAANGILTAIVVHRSGSSGAAAEDSKSPAAQAWSFQLSGSAAAVDAQAKAFQKFVSSVHFADGSPQYDPPNDWKPQGTSATAHETFVIPGEPPLELAISVLPNPEKDETAFLLANVNRWRRQLGLRPTGRDQLVDMTRKVPLADGTATLVSLEDEKTYPATRWLLDMVTGSKEMLKHRVLRIVNDEVLATFHLKPREGFLYSIAELQPHLKEFDGQITALENVKPAAMSIYQKKLLDLNKKLNLCRLLMASFMSPEVRPEHALDDLKAAFREAEDLASHQVPLSVPPVSAEGRWELFPKAWVLAYAAQAMHENPNPATIALETMFVSYAGGKVDDFNQAVDKYEQELTANPPPGCNLTKVDYEAWFNHFEPFFWAWILDLGAILLTVLAWFGWNRQLNRMAFWILVLTLAVHTLGLVSRIYISGRPPVTNLYSATVFIGWAGMIFGLTLEAIYRLGIGNLIASVAGFGALFVAHFLAADGDTLIVLQAVLDTQFWLATHVVCVTLGYSATFVAGLLGIFSIFHGAATRSRSPEMGRTLARMTYGTLCFAIFFSFVGTVLGGLWADDSWGRFWGWDPKENGALMIVAWNALVLHARWGGLVRDRGLAMLAVWGNAVVAWSYFGVNELGVGLHSYGFTEGISKWLAIFIVAQLAIITLGLVDRWLSLRPAQAAA